MFPSIRVFSNESILRFRWPEYWSFSISLSNEYSGLVFFRIDWLDLLAVQGTLKSLLYTTVQSINSLVLSLLCGPALISIHDSGKNLGKLLEKLLHSFGYADLCYQSDVSAC